jgi:hypothetical protein
MPAHLIDKIKAATANTPNAFGDLTSLLISLCGADKCFNGQRLFPNTFLAQTNGPTNLGLAVHE